MKFPTYERQNKWLIDYVLPIFTGELHKISENYRNNRVQPTVEKPSQTKQPDGLKSVFKPKHIDELANLFQPKLTKEGAIDLNFEPVYLEIPGKGFCLVLPDEPKIRPH